MNTPYIPSQKILEKYADVIVNYALGGGRGIKRGDTVMVSAPEVAKPLYVEVLKAIWKAGGNVIERYTLDNSFEKDFFDIASSTQLDFFPEKLLKGQVEEIDHSLRIDALTEPMALKKIDPKKILRRSKALDPYREWFYGKEHEKKLTWCIVTYGTEEMAKEAGLSIKEYWNQITKACFLDFNDPIKKWKEIEKTINRDIKKLDALNIEKLHVEGPDADIWIQIGKERAWKGGGGANIPSFEIFTSPDWRGTNGWIKFNQPLYRYGNLIKGIRLEFKNGVIVKATAEENNAVLQAMITTKNADKLGEFSLTDKRLSRITKFMADTLYDENIGGKHGNTHMAVGASFKECLKGDSSKFTKEDWEKLGYNDSVVHTDIMSTAPRTVTAYLPNSKTKVIYKNGQFTL